MVSLDALLLAISGLQSHAEDDLEGYHRVGYEEALEDLLEVLEEWED